MRPLLVFAVLVLSAASARADAVVNVSESEPAGYTRLVLIALAFCSYLLIRYTAAHFDRVREAARSVPTPVSLLVAERVARAVQRRAGMIAAIGIVGVPALVVMHISSLAILSTIVGCIGLRGFFIARAALQLIERAPGGNALLGRANPGVPTTAGVLGHSVIVRSGDEEVRLDVSPRTLAAARGRGVPTSVANWR